MQLDVKAPEYLKERQLLKNNTLLTSLKKASPDTIKAYINETVTDLESAKEVLILMALVLLNDHKNKQ